VGCHLTGERNGRKTGTKLSIAAKDVGETNMKKQSIHLHWFRNDLRLEDHKAPALAQEHSFFIPVYIVDPRTYAHHPLGFTKTGVKRMAFLLESLQQLDYGLQQMGSRLLVFTGYPEVILPSLVSKLEMVHLTATKEYTTEEIRIEEALKSSLPGISFYHDLTLIHPDDVPFDISDLPEMFTSFRKIVESKTKVRAPYPTVHWIPPLPSGLPITQIPTLEQLGMFHSDIEKGLEFKGGYHSGKERLQEYLFDSKLISIYKETRNGLMGMDYSSKFSPWLSVGALSARMIYHAVKAYEQTVESNESTYWMIFELLWRDYFKFIAMKHGNKIFKPQGIKGTAPSDQHRDKAVFQRWCKGQTGNDFVDAGMRELLHTGFLSNRLRQNVASYLCKDLKIDWTWGAAWFESRLIDYDTSSNWGNWMYIAGVGNDPREGRYFNTQKQASMYDPDEAYRSYWLDSEFQH
jgi:deoxyribodipyrimidine photo-lyase